MALAGIFWLVGDNFVNKWKRVFSQILAKKKEKTYEVIVSLCFYWWS